MVSAEYQFSMFPPKLLHARTVQSSVFGSMKLDKVPFVCKTVDSIPMLMHGILSLLGHS